MGSYLLVMLNGSVKLILCMFLSTTHPFRDKLMPEIKNISALVLVLTFTTYDKPMVALH